MTNPIRFLVLALVTAAIGFAGGAAEARVHHHRQHAAPAAKAAPACHPRRHHPCPKPVETVKCRPSRHHHCPVTAPPCVPRRHHACPKTDTAPPCHPSRHHHCPVTLPPCHATRHHACPKTSAAPTPRACLRHPHSRACRYAMAAATHPVSRRHHTPTTSVSSGTAGNNGTCKSVRIHGQWVQQCHFPDQP